MIDLEDNINKFYSEYPYEKKYTEVFKEYYSFYTVVFPDCSDVKDISKSKPNSMSRNIESPNGVTGPTTKPVNVGGIEYPVHNAQFYQAYLNYLIKHGKVDRSQKYAKGNKSNDTLLWEIYTADLKNEKNNKPTAIIRMKTIHYRLMIISALIRAMKYKMDKDPIIPYLVTPSSNEIKGFTRDANKYAKDISLIFNNSFNTINECSWYIFEAMYFKSNGNKYNEFEIELGIPPCPIMSQYLNLSVKDREKALFRMKLNLSKEQIEFINKHPIFSHIHFNSSQFIPKGQELTQELIPVIQTKSYDRYKKVMQMYNILMDDYTTTCGPSTSSTDDPHTPKALNLSNFGSNFKLFVNAIYVMDLYLNEYMGQMIEFYKKERMTSGEFFMELWMPFAKDLILNRVVIGFAKYWQTSWVGHPFPTVNYIAFSANYKLMQNIMLDVVKKTWSSLFTSSKVSAPPPPRPDSDLTSDEATL
jgi:hypothetical protein